MRIRDIKVGDILCFGGHHWFKADATDAFIATVGIGAYPYGYTRRENDRTIYISVAHKWLNSYDEQFDPANYADLGSWSRAPFRSHPSGFLYEFEPEETEALTEEVRLPDISDVFGDNRLPLFKKMGVRMKDERGRHMVYWLNRPENDTWGTPCVARNGQVNRYYACANPLQLRPIIHINPDLTVVSHEDVQTPYFSKPKKAYEIDFSNAVIETITYTEEDFESLFGLE